MTDPDKLLRDSIAAGKAARLKEETDAANVRDHDAAFYRSELNKLAGVSSFATARGCSVTDSHNHPSGLKPSSWMTRLDPDAQIRINIPIDKSLFGKYRKYREFLISYYERGQGTTYQVDLTVQGLKYQGTESNTWRYEEEKYYGWRPEAPCIGTFSDVDGVMLFFTKHLADVKLRG